MRVLITGGAGCIGSHLAERFVLEGAEVTVLDDLSSGSVRNMGHLLRSPGFSFVQGDILDTALMDRLVESHDLICHLAAVVGVRRVLSDPVRTIQVNATGTETLLGLAHRYGRRVLFASSSEVYGKNPRLPFTEDADRVLGSTQVPRWCYATAKALGEHLCLGYHERGLSVSVVRYVGSYGPRLDPCGYGSVVAAFISRALAGEPLSVHGDGLQTRCFTYVSDIVEGSLLAATRNEALGQAFNIGSSHCTTILDLAKLIVHLTGSGSSVAFLPYAEVYGPRFEDMNRTVDVEKAWKVLGFQARWPLVEGLETTIEWFKDASSGSSHPGC